MENVKCLIIGSGPSGYTAAIYTSRANLSPVLYEGIEPGGQLTTTTEIENFPGFTEGIDGPKLMDNMRRQALRFGADIRPGVITSVDLSSRPFHVIVNGEKEIQAEANTWYGGFGIVADGHHEASSVCFKHIWQVCADKLEDDLIIMIPRKDVVLFAPAGNKETVQKMIDHGEQAYEQGENKISKSLYRFSRERKELVTYEE